jgi:hypothetical protein
VTRIYPTLEVSALRQRAEAFARFADWERRHPPSLALADAVSGVALLFELLPKSSRTRPVETDGVAQLHRCLSVRGQPTG